MVLDHSPVHSCTLGSASAETNLSIGVRQDCQENCTGYRPVSGMRADQSEREQVSRLDFSASVNEYLWSASLAHEHRLKSKVNTSDIAHIVQGRSTSIKPSVMYVDDTRGISVSK
jgi:hypothetical protein